MMDILFIICITILYQPIQLQPRSIYTGTTPSTTWNYLEMINKATGKICIVRRDASVKTLGEGTDKEGAMSPNLLSTTITDELRMATNFKGKVIGLVLKTGAILPPDILLMGILVAQQVLLFPVLFMVQICQVG
jgi:hypothetical protein